MSRFANPFEGVFAVSHERKRAGPAVVLPLRLKGSNGRIFVAILSVVTFRLTGHYLGDN